MGAHDGRIHPTANTANDRFKRGSSAAWPLGLMAAVLLHAGVILVFPRMSAPAPALAAVALRAVDVPPEVRVPPPPEQIARPATPRVAEVEVSEDLTIAPTTFERNPVENLPPPPTGAVEEDDRPRFIPYTVAPRLKNREDVLALLHRKYPTALRNAGIGGSVQLWIYIDQEGQVVESRVARSSGSLVLDQVAQEVASRMEFTPAMNRDRVTPVWISQPIDFSVVG